MKNKVDDLRNHLFATLEALQDDENPMDVERAKTISDVAQTVINSAKVEVEFMKVTGQQSGSGFLPVDDEQEPPGQPRLAATGSNRRR